MPGTSLRARWKNAPWRQFRIHLQRVWGQGHSKTRKMSRNAVLRKLRLKVWLLLRSNSNVITGKIEFYLQATIQNARQVAKQAACTNE